MGIYMIKRGLVIAMLILPSLSTAQEVVSIPKVIPYAPGVGSDDLRADCTWNSELSDYVVKFAKSGVVIFDGAEPSLGKVLSMSITGVHAIGGGGYTGPKWATVHGELKEGGTIIGSFDIRRTTGSGGFTACSTLDRIGKAIGKDIALWLKSPSSKEKTAYTQDQ